MTRKLRMTLLGITTSVVLTTPVALAISCGEKNEFVFKEASSASSVPITPDSVKVVTDGGPINDMSFNQQAWEALGTIRGLGGTTPIKERDSLQPTPYGDTSKIVNSYRNFAQDSTVSTILAPGFAQVDPIMRFITDYDNALNFIVVDGVVPGPNVASITFRTDEAAFLAGNLAAHYLVDIKADPNPTVGTFGGGPFPGVTDFMKGFVEGIAYYNANNGNGKDIAFAKFDTDSAYTNTGFAQNGGTAAAQKLLTGGADVILPVAGPQTLDVINAIIASQKDTKIIGVDTNQAVMYHDHAEMFLTSIQKEISTAFVNVYKQIDNDESTTPEDQSFNGLGEITVGNLENGLVSIATPTVTEDTTAIYSASTTGDVLTAAKATPKFATWTQALAYLKGGANPYATTTA